MAKVRNVVMLGVSSVVTCAALLTQGLAGLGVEFPESTGIGQDWRYLEGRAVAQAPEVSLRAFASGGMQDAVEDYAADSLPLHDQAMLLNAALQRVGISQAASLAGYDVYPTYYGSTRLYIPSQDAVTYLPFSHDPHHDQRLAEWAQGLHRFAQAYPDKRFVVYVVGGYQEPAVDPAYALVSNAFTPQVAVDAFAAQFADCPNVSVLTDTYDSLDDYYREFFRSDHHWNILGALRGYNTIAAALGLQAVDVQGLSLREVLADYTFSGATARWGRCMVADEAFDADLDYSSVSYEAGGEVLDGNDHSAFFGYDPAGIEYAFYDAYYNSVPDGTIQGPGQGSALLISNSYGGAIQRQLATQFATLDKSVALWPGYTGMDFAGLLDESGADTIVFVANPSDYMNAVTALPDFFSASS